MLQGYKTYLGILITVLPTVAGLFGFTLSPLFGEQLTGLLAEIIPILGAALAVYGRAKAQIPGWAARQQPPSA